MRFGLILLCAGLLSAQPSQPARDKCRLEGKVLNAATGAPVRKVQVILIGMPNPASRPAPGQAYTPQARLGATTDSEGRFVFEALDAGRYTATANRDGFQNPATTAARRTEPILLAAGEEKRDLVLRLEPLSVISGHVRDEDGDPLRRAQVNVMTYQYTAKGRELANRNSTITNDLGEYRIFDLQPGKYYIRVTLSPSQSVFSLLTGSNQDSYAPAFYPGAREASSASMIDLRPGQEQSGTDIMLRHTRTVTVSGRLMKPVGAPQTSVRLAQMDPGSNPSTGGVSMDAQDGFRILQVLPGSYVLTADVSVGDKGYAARVPLQVGGNDIQDVVVPFVPTFDMNGRVQIEGTPPAGRGGRGALAMQSASAPGSQISSPMSQIMLNLNGRFPRTSTVRRMADGSMIVSTGTPRPNDDGTIVFRDLAPDIYTVSVNVPGLMYLKSMRCGNAEIGDSGIDLTGGSACELSVDLSYNVGRIEGSVQDENGQPAASAMLTLVPVGSIRKSVLFKQGGVSQQGSFTIQGIAPGAYKLYAWEDVDTNAVRYDPDFLKPYEAFGQAVQVSEGSSESVTVKLIKRPAEP